MMFHHSIKIKEINIKIRYYKPTEHASLSLYVYMSLKNWVWYYQIWFEIFFEINKWKEEMKLTVVLESLREWDSSLCEGGFVLMECVVSSSASIKPIEFISSSICKVLFSLLFSDSSRSFVGLRDFLRDIELLWLLLVSGNDEVVLNLFVSVKRNGAEFCWRCLDDEFPSINMTSSSTSRSPRWPGINSVRIVSCCWS